MSVERRYALRRIGAGDYLLPSNDGRTLWRVQRYTDGPSAGLADWPRDLTFWRVLRWPHALSEDTKLDEYDVGDLSRWHEVAEMFKTRRDAIRAALSPDPRGGAR